MLDDGHSTPPSTNKKSQSAPESSSSPSSFHFFPFISLHSLLALPVSLMSINSSGTSLFTVSKEDHLFYISLARASPNARLLLQDLTHSSDGIRPLRTYHFCRLPDRLLGSNFTHYIRLLTFALSSSSPPPSPAQAAPSPAQ